MDLPSARAAGESSFPASWGGDVMLRDGTRCHVRPISPEDAERLVAFHERLSQRSVHSRFFASYPHLSLRDVHRFTHVDYQDRVALVAIVEGAIIGVVRYDRVTAIAAEVAFVVADAYQRRGLGTLFLQRIAQVARERGFITLVAQVLMGNRAMLSVFEHSGYPISSTEADGVVSVRLDITAEPR